VEFRGYVSSQTQSKASGPEVLNEKKLSVPVDLLRARWKTSAILTNQKAELYVERIFSHSICSEQIFKLVKPAEVSFPDYYNSVALLGRGPSARQKGRHN
jgi:hypothetical protein